MTFDEFVATIESRTPAGVSPVLQALWHDARGDWEAGHRIVQDLHGPDATWVHAYLHRKEGDLSNARYWYRHAGQPESQDTLEAEWRAIVTALLERQYSQG